MRDTTTWEDHALRPRVCMTPRCGEVAVPGRGRCSKHGPSNAKRYEVDPYDWGHQQRRKARIEAGEQCAYRHLGGCEGEPHLDHIIPLSRGGWKGSDNEQLLCRRHNLEKWAK